VAHSLSAKKRIRQNTKNRKINRARKSQVKTQIKHLESALAETAEEKTAEEYRLVTKKLDKAASAGAIHKRTAARKKSRLAKKLNTLKAKKV
jgi:small subunit ribosomal protein S20